MHRRDLLRSAALSATALGAAPAVALAGTGRQRDTIRPPRLRPGDTIGLVSPAGVTLDASDLDRVGSTFARLGFQVAVGPNALAQVGYFAGTDEERAADVMRFVRDDRIAGIVTIRGGWGCARMLPFLDFDAIREHPKVLCGFSDVTSLLLAVYARAGMVGFHGPNAVSRFDPFTASNFRSVVIDGEEAVLANPGANARGFVARDIGEPPGGARTTAIRPGTARGPLAGGNLTVLTSLVGTPYLPSFEGHILFVEDIGEGIYRIDRMLTQLAQAGALDGITGFVLGACARCDPDSGDVEGFTLEEVIRQHIEPLGIPAIVGLNAIGHTGRKVTVPIGVEAALDADAGTIRLLAPAVL